MIVQFLILLFLGHVGNSATTDCAAGKNCNIDCTSSSCVNLTINCPTAGGFTCTVTCSANLACSNTTINAGSGVSKLTLNTVSTMQTQAIRINSAASDVIINCLGDTCYELELRATNASQVAISCNSQSKGSGCWRSAWLVTFSNKVTVTCQGRSGCLTNQGLFSTITSLSFDCNYVESCLSNKIALQSNTQATVLCAVGESCANNIWTSDRDDNVEFSFLQKSSSQDDVWNITNAGSLVVSTVDEGITDGTFNLDVITTFFFTATGYARTPYTQWNRNQIGQLYLQQMGATSYWLTNDGSSSFACDNNKPCFIRSDISRTDSGQFFVTCPQDVSGQGGDICRLYCVGDSDSCNNMYVSTMQSSNTVITSISSSGLQIYADSSAVKNRSQLHLECVDGGCVKAQVYSYLLNDIYLSCTGENACYGIFLDTIYTKSSVNIACNSYLSCGGGNFIVIGDAFSTPRLQFTSNTTMSASNWEIADFQRADFTCSGTSSCFNMTLYGRNIANFHMVCDGTEGLACDHGILNISGTSNVTLACSQNGCVSNSVYCPPQAYDTSCNINCLYDSNGESSLPACKSMDIYTTSSFGFGDSVNLTCQNGFSNACEDVTIHCGQKYLCSCPVTLEEEQSVWYCDGQCGTEECVESTHKGSKTSAGIIAVAVIIPLLVMIALIVGGGWWWSRRRQQEEVALLKPREQSLDRDSKQYETY